MLNRFSTGDEKWLEIGCIELAVAWLVIIAVLNSTDRHRNMLSLVILIPCNVVDSIASVWLIAQTDRQVRNNHPS